MIAETVTHLLADALLIPSSHQGEKWRFLWVELHTDTRKKFVCLLFNYFSICMIHSDDYSLLQFLHIILFNKAPFQPILNQTTPDTSVSRCSKKKSKKPQNPPENFKGYKWSRWWLWTLDSFMICYEMALQDDKMRRERWGQIRE